LYDQLYANQPSVGSQLTVPAPVQHLLADLTGPHAVMALAHLAAAAVVGLWLAIGERALWTVLALMGDGLRSLVAATVAAYYACVSLLLGTGYLRGPHDPSRSWGGAVDVSPRVRVLARTLSRRGPPLLLAA
jgi:hypothetical protein